MKKAGFITGAIILGTAFFLLAIFVTMWLWNWLMPAIFGLGTITFWQSAGILILSKILFSGGCHSSRWHSERKKRYWHSRLDEKWNKMPDDKKEKFIQRMREKGFHNHTETEENKKES